MDTEEKAERVITRLLNEERLKYWAELQEKEAVIQKQEMAPQEKDRLIADLMKQLADKQK